MLSPVSSVIVKDIKVDAEDVKGFVDHQRLEHLEEQKVDENDGPDLGEAFEAASLVLDTDALLTRDLEFLESNELLPADDVLSLSGRSADSDGERDYYRLKSESGQARLRASLAESKCEALQQELHDANIEVAKLKARLDERNDVHLLLSAFASQQKQREQGQGLGQGRARSQTEPEPEAASRREERLDATVQELRRQVDKAHVDAQQREKAFDDAKARLERAEQIGAQARKEYEANVEELRAELQSTLAGRQVAEKERRGALEADREELRKQLGNAKCVESKLEGILRVLRQENAVLAEQQTCKIELEAENKKLMHSLDEAHLQLATIKMDLATRRSDEDGLAARLEELARMEMMQHQQGKNGTRMGARSGSAPSTATTWAQWWK